LNRSIHPPHISPRWFGFFFCGIFFYFRANDLDAASDPAVSALLRASTFSGQDYQKMQSSNRQVEKKSIVIAFSVLKLSLYQKNVCGNKAFLHALFR
jgi:hypothetical protein